MDVMAPEASAPARPPSRARPRPPRVLDASRHPWILSGAAAPDRVAEVVRRPSGAPRCHRHRHGPPVLPGQDAAEPPDSPTTGRRPPPAGSCCAGTSS
ncbi:hypothetical protein [Streptomyces sp. NPDC057325]|uniref:hypothetical protein n=1 Tax=unclassified Streptomyces TaxID=2593676 RepID=UPI00362D4A2A